MFKNLLKVTFRNIARYKGFSFITIMGLTLGLSSCLLIGLYVWDENQYDKFLQGGDQVYRVYSEYTNSSGTETMAVTPPAFANSLQKDYPEVEQTARVMMQARYKLLFENGPKKFYEENGFFADSTFLQVFGLQFKYGSPAKALDDASSIILSEEMAERFYGKENPVGRQLIMNKGPMIVKAVFMRDPKFHLQFNYLAPLASIGIPATRMQSWEWHQFFTYVKLKKGASVRALETKFQQSVKQRANASQAVAGDEEKPFFQRLKDIHLYSAGFKFDRAERGNITYVNGLSVIAVFIILIACFNFVNLATARSLKRAKEVGVRKSIGAGRSQLITQFTGETILLSLISALIALGVAFILLPWLNRFAGKEISVGLLLNPVTLFLLTALVGIVGILAGFYPAVLLSRFKPVNVLKGGISGSAQPGKIAWIRHGLVVVQFTLSVLLIISALVVFKQVNYLHHKDLGFRKEQILFFPMRGDNMFKNQESFKGQLMNLPGVASVSIGYGFPGDAVAGDQIIVHRKGEKITQSATQLAVDFDYVKTLGLQLVAGRDFSKAMGTDQDHAWIINETAVKEFGYGSASKAIGQTLSWHPWNASNPDSLKTGPVIGVVKDFNYKSLYDKVETAVLQIYPEAAWKVAVKIKTDAAGATLGGIKTVWNRFTPEFPIEYKFLDENFEEFYQAEDKLKTLLWIFTGIAIFVGCLGLFGLAAYTAARRKKEISIRKVLGATPQNLVILLSREFVGLVLLSLLVASPIAWYFMNKWLQDFAYRINIGWWVFAVAGISALFIAVITVSFQAIRAALANPVRTLRAE